MTKPPVLGERASGILLHPTSLPGPYGSGDLGRSARDFVEFLESAGQRWWQMLPVGPPGIGHSPYSAQSAFAGNPMLIDLEALVDEGLLRRNELPPTCIATERLDFEEVEPQRDRALRAAHRRFVAHGSGGPEFEAFLAESSLWLDDFALWSALQHSQPGVPWTQWEPSLRRREAGALARTRRELDGEIGYAKFAQYVFGRQWAALRDYCHERGVGLIGDIPIFVAQDSADVWSTPAVFRLNEDGTPAVVSGVPPDYFSKTGQRWGNPLYSWVHLRKAGYGWWIERFRTTFARFDAVRLDHFIGFCRYWEVPANEPTAENGRWMRGPGRLLFDAVRETFGQLPLIAEDLGAVTPKVFALRDRFELPGTKILQYAFGNDPNAADFQPHSFPRNAVVYTGTHDNDTTIGWFHDPGGTGSRSPEQTALERKNAMRYLATDGHEIHWDLIRAALASVANTAIIPLQDVLGLGSGARMNTPGTASGNWAWRFLPSALDGRPSERLAVLTETYGRAAGSRVRTMP
jgi:4-alpha-glucanotransferase